MPAGTTFLGLRFRVLTADDERWFSSHEPPGAPPDGSWVPPEAGYPPKANQYAFTIP